MLIMPTNDDNSNDNNNKDAASLRLRKKDGVMVVMAVLLQSFWYISTANQLAPQPAQSTQDHIVDHSVYESNAFNMPTSKKLVVFNALGKVHNLVLVEHARRNVFKPGEWDCVAFMFAKEDRIPKNNENLKKLQNELQCTIPRTPGIFWGDFLQFMVPVFTSNFDYIALVLDDIFMPIQGQYTVNATKLIERMETYDIDVIQPAIVGDTHSSIKRADGNNMTRCIVEVPAIETYAQIFTKDAWECFYSMLDYDGSRGWCYDLCFKPHCPNLKLAIDFSMQGWHMDRKVTRLPRKYISGTNVTKWRPELRIKSEGYQDTNGFAVCKRLSQSSKCYAVKDFQEFEFSLITCPSNSMNQYNSYESYLINTETYNYYIYTQETIVLLL